MNKILFITDLTNGESEEDTITIKYLKKTFDVTVSYFDNIEDIEESFDIIVMRNTRPSEDGNIEKYHYLSQDFLSRAKAKNLNIYNNFDARADRNWKEYLIELYKKNYPVIPSIDSLNELHTLPPSKEYLLKPISWFSSIGIKTVTQTDLKNEDIEDYIIQPKMKYKYEISFYFIDWKLLYCLIFEPSKLPMWPKPKILKPSKKDVDFAMKFVNRNKMRIWIQRIDAIRCLDDSLLLLEIEDDSPLFSLTEIPEDLKESFLKWLKKSITKQINLKKD